MAIEIITPASRLEWLGLRHSTVGASEVAALLQCHPYLTAHQLWLDKTGTARKVTETAPMRRGRLLEPVAIECLREERPKWTITANSIPGGCHWRDPLSGMSCTPDAFADDPKLGLGVVQIKTVERSVFERKWMSDAGGIEPPLFIVIQAIQEATLTGARWACVVPLVVGWGFALDIPEVIDIPLHVGAIKTIKAAVNDFWNRVARNDPPQVDYARDGEAIAQMWAGTGPIVDLSGDNELPVIAAEDQELKERMKADKGRRQEIKNQILHKLGSARGATFAGGSVKATTIDVKEHVVSAHSYPRLTIKLERTHEE